MAKELKSKREVLNAMFDNVRQSLRTDDGDIVIGVAEYDKETKVVLQNGAFIDLPVMVQ